MVFTALEQLPLTERVASVVAGVSGLHEGLRSDRAWCQSENDLLQVCGDLARLRSGVEAAYLAAVAEVDRRRDGAVPDGVRGSRTGIGSSTESFLRTSAPLTPGQARSDVAAARALSAGGGLDQLAPQLADGAITRAHVDVATQCLRRIPGHLLREADDRAAVAGYFATLAPTRHARDLQRNATALLERLAPEVVDRHDPRAHERRFFDSTTDSTGMLVGHFALDAAAGATLLSAVEACAAPLPTDGEQRDTRTAPQRRADALVTIAERAMAVVSPIRGERPRVVVHTTAEQLAGALATGPLAFGPGSGWTENGQDLGHPATRRLSCDAVLQRVTWDRDGSPLESMRLDLGREVRLADVQLRRALAARDRGCVVPGCSARPNHCDAHHVVHWADGGPTSLANLVLLCGSHHTAVHAGVWQVSIGADSVPEVVPPERVDPLRRPRRAPHHDLGPLLEAMDPGLRASRTGNPQQGSPDHSGVRSEGRSAGARAQDPPTSRLDRRGSSSDPRWPPGTTFDDDGPPPF